MRPSGSISSRRVTVPCQPLRRAMAGFDTALWDLRGKRAGKPVAELLVETEWVSQVLVLAELPVVALSLTLNH